MQEGQKLFVRTSPVSTWAVVAKLQRFPSVLAIRVSDRQSLLTTELSIRFESRRTGCARNSRGSWLFWVAELLLKVWCYQAWRIGGMTNSSFYFLIEHRLHCVVMLEIGVSGWSFALPCRRALGTQDFVSYSISWTPCRWALSLTAGEGDVAEL